MEAEYNFIRKIGDRTVNGITVFDTGKQKFIYANRHFLDIVDVEEESAVNNSQVILQLVLGEDLEYLRSRVSELQEVGFLNDLEVRLKYNDGIVKHLSCDLMMLEGNRLVAAFVKDISNAKRHEDYLIKYTAQKDTMLDMLTHNLSGPLLLSRDVIDALQNDYNGHRIENVSRLIGIISQNTQHCIDIVNDFLRQEHYESAQTFVKKTRFDLIEKINVTLDKLRTMNKDKTLLLTTPFNNLNINSDPVKFFQVMHNILSNAIKYTQDNGVIEIEVSEEEGAYVILVRDNGTGIPEILKPAIFQERMKGMPGLKGEKSNGLGLSIAKKLVHIMGGDIWFQSQEGTGSSFYIKLPKE